jgi:hypothetical protein
MKSIRFNRSSCLMAVAVLTFGASSGSAYATMTLLSEDFDRATTSGTDINNLPDRVMIGVSFNSNNPIVANGAQGGNVLKDQGGFGGAYGVGTNAGAAARVRSSNGAMFNEAPLQLATLGATSVTLSFDLKQVTANYVQVVEYSTDAAFTSPVLLDTITGLGTLGLWEAKSYTLVDGVDTTFIDTFYFRIRKLRPSPAGTTGGANSTYHTYDNLLITAEVLPPASEKFQLVISSNGANFDFSWDSQDGKVYDLVSSTDFATPISTWAVYDPDGVGGNDPFGDIPATGTTTTLTAVAGDGIRRFFSMVEKDAPP